MSTRIFENLFLLANLQIATDFDEIFFGDTIHNYLGVDLFKTFYSTWKSFKIQNLVFNIKSGLCIEQSIYN